MPRSMATVADASAGLPPTAAAAALAGLAAVLGQGIAAVWRPPQASQHAPSVRLRLGAPASVRLLDPRAAVAGETLEIANFMRGFGARLANAEKNTGAARFALHAFQRAFFPPELRCPLSVIDNAAT